MKTIFCFFLSCIILLAVSTPIKAQPKKGTIEVGTMVDLLLRKEKSTHTDLNEFTIYSYIGMKPFVNYFFNKHFYAGAKLFTGLGNMKDYTEGCGKTYLFYSMAHTNLGAGLQAGYIYDINLFKKKLFLTTGIKGNLDYYFQRLYDKQRWQNSYSYNYYYQIIASEIGANAGLAFYPSERLKIGVNLLNLSVFSYVIGGSNRGLTTEDYNNRYMGFFFNTIYSKYPSTFSISYFLNCKKLATPR